MLVGGFAASDWLFNKVYELLTPLGLNIVRAENHVWVFFKIETTLLFKTAPFKETKPFLMEQSHPTSTILWGLVFPNSHMVPFAPSHTIQVLQTTDHGLAMCSSLHLGPSGSADLSTSPYPKWFVTSFFLRSMFLKIFWSVEHSSFGDDGIPEIFLPACRLFVFFPISYLLCLVLPWKCRDSKVERHWYEWEVKYLS